MIERSLLHHLLYGAIRFCWLEKKLSGTLFIIFGKASSSQELFIVNLWQFYKSRIYHSRINVFRVIERLERKNILGGQNNESVNKWAIKNLEIIKKFFNYKFVLCLFNLYSCLRDSTNYFTSNGEIKLVKKMIYQNQLPKWLRWASYVAINCLNCAPNYFFMINFSSIYFSCSLRLYFTYFNLTI